MKLIRPLLSPQNDPLSDPSYFNRLRYPLLLSPKFDGIRGVVQGGQVVSRTGKSLPSYQVQDEFSKYEGLDGELVVDNPVDYNVYNRSQSHVMSADKPGDVTYYVFDTISYPNEPFYERLQRVERLVEEADNEHLVFVKHHLVRCEGELLDYEKKYLDKGYEGIMIRDPDAPYKFGRATVNEGIIYKLKRFRDAEGILVAIHEQLHNTNEATTNSLGYTERSDTKDAKVRTGMAGGFTVVYEGEYITVAPGMFTHSERRRIFHDQSAYLGKLIKFRYFAYGMKDKPRFPRAIGFRNEVDL